jgi:glycosidase
MNTIPGLPVIYYGSEFGMTGASDPDNRRMMRFGEELNQFEKRMLGDVRKIINLRKNHPALRYGDFLTLQADENVYSYIRSGVNERILIILNKSEKSVPLQLNIPVMYGIKSAGNLLTDEKIELVDGSVNLILQPMSYSFFKLY